MTKKVTKKITKQEFIEKELDKLDRGTLAAVALVARKSCQDWKAYDFIKGFSHSIGPVSYTHLTLPTN